MDTHLQNSIYDPRTFSFSEGFSFSEFLLRNQTAFNYQMISQNLGKIEEVYSSVASPPTTAHQSQIDSPSSGLLASPGSDYCQSMPSHPNPQILDPDMFFNNSIENFGFPEVKMDCTADMTLLPASTMPIFGTDLDIYTDYDAMSVRSNDYIPAGKVEECPVVDDIAKALEKINHKNSNLISLVEKVLHDNLPHERELSFLNTFERCIVEAVADKKRKNPNKNRDKGKKREEEKQKFFFKALLKYTEQKFFADLTKSKKTKRRELDKNSYYDYYWGDISSKHDIDLSSFYHPGKKVKSTSLGNTTAPPMAENRKPKSINSIFIDRILMSDKFKEEALYYLDHVFIQENASQRAKKAKKMLEKLREVVTKILKKSSGLSLEDQTRIIIDEIRQYIIFNPKSKLPWSHEELVEAKEFARASLQRSVSYQDY